MYQYLSNLICEVIFNAVYAFVKTFIISFFGAITIGTGLNILTGIIWIIAPSLNHSIALDCVIGLMLGAPFGFYIGASTINARKVQQIWLRLYPYGMMISIFYFLLWNNGNMHYYENCPKDSTYGPFRVNTFSYIC